jgi:hypothetical protein
VSDPTSASAHPKPDASDIDIEAGVGHSSRLGYVKLRWGSQSGQLTTREARAHALAILDAAAAADHDASVLRWLMRPPLNMPVESAAMALAELRKARALVDEEAGNI